MCDTCEPSHDSLLLAYCSWQWFLYSFVTCPCHVLDFPVVWALLPSDQDTVDPGNQNWTPLEVHTRMKCIVSSLMAQSNMPHLWSRLVVFCLWYPCLSGMFVRSLLQLFGSGLCHCSLSFPLRQLLSVQSHQIEFQLFGSNRTLSGMWAPGSMKDLSSFQWRVGMWPSAFGLSQPRGTSTASVFLGLGQLLWVCLVGFLSACSLEMLHGCP